MNSHARGAQGGWIRQTGPLSPGCLPSSTPTLSDSRRFPCKRQLACLLPFFKTLAFLRGERTSSAGQVLFWG